MSSSNSANQTKHPLSHIDQIMSDIEQAFKENNAVLVEFRKNGIHVGYIREALKPPIDGFERVGLSLFTIDQIRYHLAYIDKTSNKNYGISCIILPASANTANIYQAGEYRALKTPRKLKNTQDGVTHLLEQKGDYIFPENLIPDGAVLGEILTNLIGDPHLSEGGTFVILTDEFMTLEQRVRWQKLSIEQKQSWWNFIYANFQQPFFERSGLTLNGQEYKGFPELSLFDSVAIATSSTSVSPPHSDPHSSH